MRMVLEQRWTQVPPAQYESESRLMGTIAPSGLEAAGGSPGELLQFLEDERASRPNEPLWTGVRDVSVAGRGVRVDFEEAVEPHLQPVAGSEVSVSCHLYHQPEVRRGASASPTA